MPRQARSSAAWPLTHVRFVGTPSWHKERHLKWPIDEARPVGFDCDTDATGCTGTRLIARFRRVDETSGTHEPLLDKRCR